VGVRGHGTLSLENGGTVNVNSGTGTVVLADEKNSTGILNIGAGLGDNDQPLGAVAAGTLEAGEIEFGRGTAILNFNHTDNNYTFDVALASVNSEDGRHQIRHR